MYNKAAMNCEKISSSHWGEILHFKAGFQVLEILVNILYYYCFFFFYVWEGGETNNCVLCVMHVSFGGS